jgi:hypothetical protein
MKLQKSTLSYCNKRETEKQCCPNICHHFIHHDWLYEKAVCTPRNLGVIDNNLKIQKSQPGDVNPLNAELSPTCHLLALLAHHILHVSRIRVNVYKSVDAVEDVSEAMQYQRTDISSSHL